MFCYPENFTQEIDVKTSCILTIFDIISVLFLYLKCFTDGYIVDGPVCLAIPPSACLPVCLSLSRPCSLYKFFLHLLTEWVYIRQMIVYGL